MTSDPLERGKRRAFIGDEVRGTIQFEELPDWDFYSTVCSEATDAVCQEVPVDV